MLQLDMALSYDEIEDLVVMVNTHSDNIQSKRLDENIEIFYDDFILALHENISKRKSEMGEKVEDKIMKRLFDALSDSG
jgi:hypothetical protein